VTPDIASVKQEDGRWVAEGRFGLDGRTNDKHLCGTATGPRRKVGVETARAMNLEKKE
jgi:hypothetical protein